MEGSDLLDEVRGRVEVWKSSESVRMVLGLRGQADAVVHGSMAQALEEETSDS